VGAKLF